MYSLLFVATGISVFLCSYAGVQRLIAWTSQRDILDIPNSRSSHSRPIPRGGGLLIVLSALTVWPMTLLFLGSSLPYPAIVAYLFGAGLVAAVSWLDDLYSLSNSIRFAAQAFAALLVLFFIGHWQQLELPITGTLTLGWLGLPLTFIWLVGLTNAYNFMDGIDGLAAGQAILTSFGWIVFAWQAQQTVLVSLAVIIGAASLAFMLHNRPPARIFMGDVGSAFLGYTFAVLPLLAPTQRTDTVTIALLLLWPFIFDTGFTLFRRLLRRENIFRAHRSHLYQRLNIVGHTHQSITLLYLAVTLLNVIIALAWTFWKGQIETSIPALLALEALVLWCGVIWREQKAVPDT